MTSYFLINPEIVGDVSFSLKFLRHFRILNKLELVQVDLREEGVALERLIDLSQVDPVAKTRTHGFLVDHRSADHPGDVAQVRKPSQRLDGFLRIKIPPAQKWTNEPGS